MNEDEMLLKSSLVKKIEAKELELRCFAPRLIKSSHYNLGEKTAALVFRK